MLHNGLRRWHGVTSWSPVCCEWCAKFGPDYARRLKRRQGRLGDTWFLDEVFVTINGQRQYLWRAVDQDGDLIDLLVQPRRDGRAARRVFRKLLKGQRQEPMRLVTDKLGSYQVAHRDVMPWVPHDTRRYANNRAEVSHQPTRQRCTSSNQSGPMGLFRKRDFLPVHRPARCRAHGHCSRVHVRRWQNGHVECQECRHRGVMYTTWLDSDNVAHPSFSRSPS